MQRTLRRLFKCLVFIALACYVVLGVAFLGIRYWVLPNIDQWRDPLQARLSSILPVQLELGHIQAHWRGRHPHFSLRDTTLRDSDGRLLLSIPELDAVVAGASLFSGSPRFLELNVDGMEITVQRDAQDQLSLVGFDVEPKGAGNADGGSGVLEWLSEQRNVRFSNARIIWRDEQRAAPPLKLEKVALSLGRSGSAYQFSILASPPPTLGTSFLMQGQVAGVLLQGSEFSLSRLSGQFHLNVEDMRPAAWQPWMDIHSVLEQGQVSWSAWQHVSNGVPGHHVSQVVVNNGVWQPDADVNVMAASAKLHLAGDWAALQAIWPTAQVPAPAPGQAPPRIALQMQGLALEAHSVFPSTLVFEQLALAGSLGKSAELGLHTQWDVAQLRNADMDVSLQGRWQQRGAGVAGLVDMEGRFEWAELAAIEHYLPHIVDDDAREWLHHGLLAGRLVQAPVRLQGDLVHFPFGERPDAGDFIVGGLVQAAVIDYAPAAIVGSPGWPRLEQLHGYAQLHNVDLTIKADSLEMRPGGERIALNDVNARISNIERNSVLEVGGLGRAQASAFLSLINTSPLGRLLEGQFEHARGSGEWQVPIKLTIPLMDANDTQVEGQVIFHNGGLHLFDAVPALSGLHGRLSFTEEKVLVHELKGQVLGGAVSISGGLGQDQQGLVFAGRLAAAGLSDYLGNDWAEALQGTAAYRLALRRGKTGAYGMTLESSLEGMALGLPPPLSKAKDEHWPLAAQWTPAMGKTDARLEIQLNHQLEASFLHKEKRGKHDSYFYSGVLNLRGKAKRPEQGMVVDVQAPLVDIDAWRDMAKRFEGHDGEAGPGLFPPLRDLRLQTDHATVMGTQLDHLTFTARQPESGRWRVDVSSTQTAGTLFWKERRGRIEGEVQAHFERLALGDGGADETAKKSRPPDEASHLSLDDELDIPALSLKVDRLRWQGRHIGALSVVGLNESQERGWRLEQLEIASPHARLQGKGWWQLRGPKRGLSLQVDALFDDLGGYLNQAGFTDLMQGGHGSIQGTIEWRDLPWKLERAGLHGDLSVDLAKGRFISVGSRSARLLELLSLQSVQRLASLNWNPAGLMQQGFPFDSLQGHIKTEKGVLHSENYRVTGPVATIVIAGDVDLPEETLDLYAVVVPNLDVSGAAIAAGIAVNPIVGVGAFLTQWLLKSPMSKAMTVEYRVKGEFDSPSIQTVNTENQ